MGQNDTGSISKRQVSRMETIHITKNHIVTLEHSSKGNQLKWEQDGYWYKADAFGFESLAETTVSCLLEYSNIQGYVAYEPIYIVYQGRKYRGCRSRNFRKENEELIPLERLVRAHTSMGLAKELARIADVKQRVLYTVELVENLTGIEGFGGYLAQMLEMDAFFLNEDRHTNNIALLYNVETKEYRLCPFYDMGLSLFSDTRDAYPLDMDFAACREQITAKPFSRDFDEQLDAVNELYGYHLKFDMAAKEIIKIMQTATAQTADMFQAEELERVEEVLRYQAGKYGYMFR